MDSPQAATPTNLTETTPEQITHMLSQAALHAVEAGEIFFPARPPRFTMKRETERIRAMLASTSHAQRVLGLDFFRRKHEPWAVSVGLVRHTDQAEYWEVWQEWVLNFYEPGSLLCTLRADPHFETALSRLPSQQREWLDQSSELRRPVTHEQLKRAMHALQDLHDVIVVASANADAAQTVLLVELLREADLVDMADTPGWTPIYGDDGRLLAGVC